MGRRREPTALGTAEARKNLPELVRKAVDRTRPSRSVKQHAVEIRPRGEKRSASLVPSIDLDAAEQRIAELEEQLENAGIALFVHERLQTTSGKRLSAAEFLEGIGMDEFVEELPSR